MTLTTFDFQMQPVRIMMRDEQPWFVAADICRVLELADVSSAVRDLDEDEKITQHNERGNPRAGIPHQINLISESGFYALVFKSRKPEAKIFRKWVTSEVLPALRQTGRYAMPETAGSEDRLSLLQFVREACNGWSIQRQIEFGLTVRRYCKSMGLVFTVEAMPNLGRVFTFPRCVLEEVRSTYASCATLLDGDAAELEKLLEAVWLNDGDASYAPEMLRGVAKTMRLFRSIFGVNTSLASERSAFGKLISRYDGRIFPSGFSVMHSRGRYHVRQTRQSRMTLAEVLPRATDQEMACADVS